MDNAVALTSSRSLAVPTTFAERVRVMPARTKLKFGVGLAALAGVVVALSMNVGQGDYKVLYAGLSDKDGGAVVAQLATMNVPYKVQAGSGAIMVPAAAGARPAPEARHGRPAEGLGLGLRADGRGALRPDPVPGAPHLPARPRGRADALDHFAGRGPERPRPPRPAEPERVLSRAAKAERLGARQPAPGPHARPRPDRRHRPPGVVERARARPEGGQRARPERLAPHRQQRRRPVGRPRRAAAAVHQPDRGRFGSGSSS